jgi:hypothetical protein
MKMETEKETIDILSDLDYEDMVDILEWNSTGRIWGKRRIEDIDKIIIHQSLSDGKIENINKYLIGPNNHISPVKGCPHICYHMAINKDGKLLLLNNFSDRTWHTKGQNRIGISICVLGNFIGTGYNKGHEPTNEQLKALEFLIEFLLDKLNLSQKDVYGHYHYGKPACPGKTCSEIIESFRNDRKIDVDIGYSLFNRLDTMKEIQEALLLLDSNALPIYGADGIAGEETKTAIVKFQMVMQIPITALADERTRAELIKQISERGL